MYSSGKPIIFQYLEILLRSKKQFYLNGQVILKVLFTYCLTHLKTLDLSDQMRIENNFVSPPCLHEVCQLLTASILHLKKQNLRMKICLHQVLQ